MLQFLLAAPLIFAPVHDWTAGLTDVQLREIVYAVCGPEGANDAIDWSLPRESCERGDWNGVSYGYPKGDDEFFCDDFAILDPERCGLDDKE